MNFKNTLRKEIDEKLSQLKDGIELSKKISDKLTSSTWWEKSNSIFLYINFRNEVITLGIIEEGIKAGKKIFAPLIKGENMTFHRIDNIHQVKLVKNSYGILEPPKEIPEEFPTKSSVMLIPGVAFTINGERLGRGGGYYDRYLAKYSNTIKIGITYNLQIVEKIELEPWDIIMDAVITENNIFFTEEL